MAARPKVIVVGFSGSEPAARALDAAADLVGYGSLLTVVSVDEPAATIPDRAAASHADSARAARELLHRRHVHATYVTAAGDPADGIVAAATKLGATLVVIGRRDAVTLPALGTVCADVLLRAPCDVLVVR